MSTEAVTTDEFEKALNEIIDGMTGADFIAIPGVYELVSEYLNNSAIERALDARDEV